MSSKHKGQGGIEGILGGLAELVGKLGDLAEQGEKLSKSGEFEWKGAGKDLKGICGFSVRTVLGGEEVRVEPFGNIRRDEQTGEPVVREVREPVVDIFEEEGHVLIVAEMPGIGAGDVRLDVKDDVLTIQAEEGDKKYRKELLLPGTYPREKMTVSCNNGILEIKCLP